MRSRIEPAPPATATTTAGASTVTPEANSGDATTTTMPPSNDTAANFSRLLNAFGGLEGGPGSLAGRMSALDGGAPGLGGTASDNAASGLGADFPGGMNPQLFQSLMSNNTVQSLMQELMANPELLRSMIQSNPFLNQLAVRVLSQRGGFFWLALRR